MHLRYNKYLIVTQMSNINKNQIQIFGNQNDETEMSVQIIYGLTAAHINNIAHLKLTK